MTYYLEVVSTTSSRLLTSQAGNIISSMRGFYMHICAYIHVVNISNFRVRLYFIENLGTNSPGEAREAIMQLEAANSRAETAELALTSSQHRVCELEKEIANLRAFFASL